MNQSFSYDIRKATANFKKHGVRFSDAEEVFLDDDNFTVEDPGEYGEQRFVVYGNSYVGLLAVVYTPLPDGVIRLISARRGTSHEKDEYSGHIVQRHRQR